MKEDERLRYTMISPVWEDYKPHDIINIKGQKFKIRRIVRSDRIDSAEIIYWVLDLEAKD